MKKSTFKTIKWMKRSSVLILTSLLMSTTLFGQSAWKGTLRVKSNSFLITALGQ